MNLYISIALCALFISASTTAQEKKGWTLVWQDEFDYTGLPDSTKWGYETGHIRNREQQYYTLARKENVYVKDGWLTITGRKEPYPNAAYRAGASGWQQKDSLAQYTSASINTLGKASWQYGRVEIKAKLPAGGGMWPALWMMGINRETAKWPFCGEIDIMEFVGNRPLDVYGTMHYPHPKTGKHASKGSKTNDSTVSSKFHLYAIEWDDEKIDVYFNDHKYFSYPIDSAGTGQDNPFRKPFYLLINLAMGADWPGPVDDAVLPQEFVVDYVRIYRKDQ
jgi:beta-glucanase (GH16 family)